MSAQGLVDTHAHLMDAAFDGDREAVVARARAAGVTAFVLVGYDLASSRAAVQLARQLPDAGATVGIHPNMAGQATAADFERIAELAREPEVVGIGETGLDNFRHFTSPERQREAFEWHLRLADAMRLPVVVHNRQADSDVAALVTAQNLCAILHCFSSTDADYLDRMLDAGCYASFAGPITFRNAAANRAMAARVPNDRLLVETDCPYLAPEPHRGQRNEPAFVRDTAACLADVIRVSLESLTATLWSNTLSAFPALTRAGVA